MKDEERESTASAGAPASDNQNVMIAGKRCAPTLMPSVGLLALLCLLVIAVFPQPAFCQSNDTKARIITVLLQYMVMVSGHELSWNLPGEVAKFLCHRV